MYIFITSLTPEGRPDSVTLAAPGDGLGDAGAVLVSLPAVACPGMVRKSAVARTVTVAAPKIIGCVLIIVLFRWSFHPALMTL